MNLLSSILLLFLLFCCCYYYYYYYIISIISLRWSVTTQTFTCGEIYNIKLQRTQLVENLSPGHTPFRGHILQLLILQATYTQPPSQIKEDIDTTTNTAALCPRQYDTPTPGHPGT